MTRTLCANVALSAAFALACAAPAGAQTLERVQKTGILSLGYIDGAPPFSFTGAKGEPEGFSVDLCRAVADSLAEQLKRDALRVRWVKLTIQDRIDAVRKGLVDLECSTTTWTLSRQALVDFSLVTFVDGGSLLVAAKSDASRINDLNDKRIAVITGTTTEKALRDALTQRRIVAEVVPIKRRDEGLELLAAGKVDALASDRTTLIGVVVTSDKVRGSFKLLDQDFSIEQYALVMRRDDPDFRLAVNRALARLYRSREIENVYKRWLGRYGPPSVLLSATYFIQSLAE